MADAQLAPARLLIQVTPVEGDEQTGRTRGSRATLALRELTAEQADQALAAVAALAQATARTIDRIRLQPEQRHLSSVSLEFGVSFNTELQAFIVKATGEATLKVTLTWNEPL